MDIQMLNEQKERMVKTITMWYKLSKGCHGPALTTKGKTKKDDYDNY